MSEMIERVARAIYESHKFVRPWDHPQTVRMWHRSCRASASAAIEAMREPTEQMIDAGVEARMRLYEKMEAEGVNTRTVVVANHPAGTIYVAMIDAALQEPTR